MRNALAQTLYQLAREDPRIVVLVADISPAGAMEDFRREFPSRFINVGVAEAAMIGLAAGLAQRGFRPFCYTIATFALLRPYEFIRCDLAYQDLPVTVVGMGAGLSYPTLGGTHQAVEDVAVAMAMPNMAVLAPCDPAETAECVRWCMAREMGGPVYLRIGKAGEPDLTSHMSTEDWDAPWDLFNGCRWLRTGVGLTSRRCVLSYGPIAAEALRLADALSADMVLVSMLRPSTGLLCNVPHLNENYDEVIVVEEASGAPVAAELSSAGVLCIRPLALPREFPHFCGTRREMLDHVGLTAEKMLVQVSQRPLASATADLLGALGAQTNNPPPEGEEERDDHS